jgi:hypothetical protein
MDALARIVEPAIESAHTSTAVLILEGGRAVGKTTVCDRLIDRHGWAPRIDLSDPDVLATLRLDPVRFLEAQPTPCVIDEAQLEPELTVWVKRIVDRRRATAQFLLTGSARLGRRQLGGSDPLAGRAVRIQMSSMTQRELRSEPSEFVDRAFGGGWEAGARVPRRDDVRDDGEWRGGLPSLAGVLAPASAARWESEIASYVEAVIPIGAMGTRADLGRLLRTFRYLAANSGQLLNVSRAASDLGMQANTVRSHLESLEAAFLLERVEAERPAEHRVLTAHPRVFAADVGLATWAARAWDGPMSAATRGALSETLVAHDVIAQANANAERVVVRHWRDVRTRREVDLLLVHPDGRLVPVEVKASSTVGPADAAGLAAFMDLHEDRSRLGIVVYDGEVVVDLSRRGERARVLAVPRRLV